MDTSTLLHEVNTVKLRKYLTQCAIATPKLAVIGLVTAAAIVLTACKSGGATAAASGTPGPTIANKSVSSAGTPPAVNPPSVTPPTVSTPPSVSPPNSPPQVTPPSPSPSPSASPSSAPSSNPSSKPTPQVAPAAIATYSTEPQKWATQSSVSGSAAQGYAIVFQPGANLWPSVNFNFGKKNGLYIAQAYPDGYDALEITVNNPNAFAVELNVGASSNSGSGGPTLQGGFQIEAGQTTQVAVPLLVSDCRTFFANIENCPPVIPGTEQLFLNGYSDPSKLTQLILSMYGPQITQATPLNITNINMISSNYAARATSPIFDGYGQYIDATDTTAVKTDATLQQAYQAELAKSSITAAAGYGPYGECAKCTAVGPVTQHFTIHKDTTTGRFMLVAPNGLPFFGLGTSGVYDGAPSAQTSSVVAGRTSLFSSLPDTTLFQGAYGKDSSGNQSLDFRLANLIRAGVTSANLESAWGSLVVQRFNYMGFNSTAASVWPTAGDAAKLLAMPFIADLRPQSYAQATVNSYINGANFALFDPFDPNFTTAAVYWMTTMWAKSLATPQVLGAISGVEMSWMGNQGYWLRPYWLPITLLGSTTPTPASTAMVTKLQALGYQLADLTRLCGAQVTAWNQAIVIPAPAAGQAWTYSATCTPILSELLSYYATTYHSTFKAILNQHAPGVLYFCDKYMAGDPAPDEVVAAASKYCDSFTVDNYASAVNATTMTVVNKYITTTPAIITECNQGITGSGRISAGWQGVVNNSLAEQAQSWTNYMNSAFSYGVMGVYYYNALAPANQAGNLQGEAVDSSLYSITNQPRPIVDAQTAIAETLYKTVFPDLVH